MPKVDHLRAGEVLGVRLMHQVMLSANVKAEVVVALLLHSPYFLDQRDDIHPFEIVRRGMPKHGFERPEVCAVYRRAPRRGDPFSGLAFIGFHKCLRLSGYAATLQRGVSLRVSGCFLLQLPGGPAYS